ncbi:hypothetical protein CK503_10250 [Aliifodinibius salipaludis]|uniref:Uncharacterized protein n=1 Tax=Fodinibius salipaludis TaxID=2032627 RepID=A0A2A2G9K4_9BACT|nr:hypothetical protein CK503_10250 [Aliifodinibius salipaludis]
MARQLRLKLSTTVKTRNQRPSKSLSTTKSILHSWWARLAAVDPGNALQPGFFWGVWPADSALQACIATYGLMIYTIRLPNEATRRCASIHSAHGSANFRERGSEGACRTAQPAGSKMWNGPAASPGKHSSELQNR